MTTFAPVKIAVYVGPGASHSWTWCVDLFEKMGVYNLSLVASGEEFARVRDGLDILVVSGGDTAAIAQGLKSWGSSAIQGFVEDGGIYVGICAGACLMLRSSKIDLCDFNFTSCTIANIADEPPQFINLAYKCSIPYKDRFVFYPIYGPIRIKLVENSSPAEQPSLVVPLFGGPAISASDDVEVLANFDEFDDTAIFAVDESLAAQTLLGKAAAVRKGIGLGCVYLLSPHFEHPSHSEANAVLMSWLASHRPGLKDPALDAMELRAGHPNSVRQQVLAAPSELRRLKSAISEGRIVARGIALRSVTWQIGKKIWEPEKLELFLLAVWKRLARFALIESTAGRESELAGLCDLAGNALTELRILKRLVSDDLDSLQQAEATFSQLQRLARSFLELYFQSLDRLGFRNRVGLEHAQADSQ